MTKLRAGKFYIECDIRKEDDRLYFFFPYNIELIKEIKSLQGRKWHGYDDPPRKVWSAPINARNTWALNYLAKDYPNPYDEYSGDPPQIELHRKVWDHQAKMAYALIHTRRAVWGASPRVGKTLAAITAIEHMNIELVWWIGPRSAIAGVTKEFRKWKPKFKYELMTYNALVKKMHSWSGETPPCIVYDECHALKNQDSQRSESARHLVSSMLDEHEDPVILAMSGSPNPKSPVDWWSICEVVCPGYIKEGHPVEFRNRLALILDGKSITGGWYPHLITYWDDETKCGFCGLHKCDPLDKDYKAHKYIKSINEVTKLYDRLTGLVIRVNKKDCMELPPIETVIITEKEDERLKPKADVLRAINTIKKRSESVAIALTLCRELSDGFQYKKVEDGFKKCPECKGLGEAWTHIDDEKIFTQCFKCHGSLKIPNYKRIAERVYTPKDDLLIECLEEHEEIGRLVIYAGFTGSVDRCVDICVAKGWNVIRVDGRGWKYFGKYSFPCDADALDAFDNVKFDQIAFVGQQESGSEGISLAASPTIFNFSNTFKWDKKYQSSERINDSNQKADCGRIIEIFYLPTDRDVYQNLMNKRDLEQMTMSGVSDG